MSKPNSPVEMSVDEIFGAMNSTDPDSQFSGMQAARKILSSQFNPPIDLMIDHGIVPICIKFLQLLENPSLQFEAAWALTLIVSGTSEQTRCGIEHDAVPHLVSLLRSENIDLAEQAALALGNIADDGAEACDFVVQHKVVDAILPLIHNETPISLLRIVVWLMLNLCRNKDPSSSPFEELERLLPVLAQLLWCNDSQVLADTCWALFFITDGDTDKKEAVVETGAVLRLVALLDNTDELSIVVPALHSIGNIVTGTVSQTYAVIAAGGLTRLCVLLQHPEYDIVREAAWIVSNITAGNQYHIQAVLDAGVFTHIRRVLDEGDFNSQKEAARAVANATMSGTPQQMITMIEHYRIMKPFCNILDSKDSRTLKVVLTGLRNFLAAAEKLGVIENLCLIIEEVGGLDKIEAMQCHENEGVYQRASTIISTYFSSDSDADDGLAPQTDNVSN